MKHPAIKNIACKSADTGHFYLEAGAFILSGADQYIIIGGLNYNINRNLKIDMVFNQGLNAVTPINAHLGLSFRL